MFFAVEVYIRLDLRWSNQCEHDSDTMQKKITNRYVHVKSTLGCAHETEEQSKQWRQRAERFRVENKTKCKNAMQIHENRRFLFVQRIDASDSHVCWSPQSYVR